MFYKSLRHQRKYVSSPVVLACLLAACQTKQDAKPELDPLLASADALAVEQGAEAPRVGTPLTLPAAPHFTFQHQRLFAEPITSILSDEFPHLRAHTGQLLLGTDNTQVVLQGISQDLINETWVNAIAAVYYRTSAGWLRQASAGRWDMRLTTPQGQALYPIGVDTEKSGTSASVVYFLGSRDARGRSPTEMRWTLLKDTQTLVVSLSGNPANPSASDTTWKMRWRDRWGAAYADPQVPAKLARVYTQYLNEDVTSLVVNGEPSIDNDALSLVWTIKAKRSWPASAYLLLGATAQDQLTLLTNDARRCLAGETPRQPSMTEPSGDWSSCLAQVPQRPLTLKAPAEPVTMPAMGWLQNLGEKTKSYVALAPGENRQLLLPKEQSFQFESILGATTNLTTEAEQLALPETKLATMILGTKAAPGDAPLLVTLHYRADMDGVGVLAYTSKPDASINRSAYQVVTRTWPLSLSLPVGSYDVSIYNGKTQHACRGNMQLEEQQQAPAMTCDMEEVASTESSRPYMRVDLSLEETSRDTLALAASLGMDLTSATLSASPKHRVISASDPDEGISLRLYPVTEQLQQWWQKNLRSGPGSPLQKIVEFKRNRAEGAILEMACPSASLSGEQVAQLLTRFAPDALQVYGCGSAARQEELKEAVAVHMRRSERAVYFTAVSGIATRNLRSPYVPSLAFFPPSDTTIAEADVGKENARPPTALLPLFLSSLNAGRYSVSAGAVVSPGIIRKVDLSKKKKGGPSTELEVKLSLGEGVRAKAVRIYSEDGLVGQQDIKASEERQLKIPLKVALAKSVRWLRVEVMGHEASSPKTETMPAEDGVRVIAASNFEALVPSN